jgi:predicted acylesterase/phospholipase RssA
MLSTAVAASAAVPGVFPPIHLDALYPDRNIRLSDGGVHDNPP